VGSDVAIQIFVIRAKRAGPNRLAYFAKEIEWYGTRILVPSSLALVILGFILLHESSGAYDLGQGWVTFGFVVWLLSFIAGLPTLAQNRVGSARWSTSAGRKTRSISAGSAGSS
jgi:uncharacterized membrane protein